MGTHERSERVLEVTLLWAGAPLASELIDGTLAIGEGTRLVVPRDVLPSPIDLATPAGDAWLLSIPENARGFVFANDRTIDVTQIEADARGLRTTLLGPSAKAQLELGAFTVLLASVDRPSELARGMSFDKGAQRWLAASAAVHVVMLGILFLSPPSAGALSNDLAMRETRRLLYTQLASEAPQLPEPPALPASAAGAEGGPRGAGESGAAGTPDGSPTKGGGIRVRGESQDRRVPLTHTQVQTAGILGALAATSGALSQVMSDQGFDRAEGFDTIDAYASAQNGEPDIGRGFGGLDLRGTGRGGGCRPGEVCAQGAIDVGRISTGVSATCGASVFAELEARYGHSEAVARCSGSGPSNGSLRARVARRPERPVVLDVAIPGGLSREQVQRTIARHVNEVRFCYTQALQASPDLHGRVSVQFVIMPDGRVNGARVAQNDVANDSIGACVADATRRWTFPAAEGVTSVTYPFVFEQASE